MASEIPPVYLQRDVGRAVTNERERSGHWVPAGRGAATDLPTGEAWQVNRTQALATAVGVQQRLKGAALAEGSAALAHGLEVWEIPTTTTVIQQVNPRSRLPRTVRRRVCALGEDDIAEIDGVRVTSLERTILDSARSFHPRDALVVADSAMRAIIRPKRNDPPAAVQARTEELRSRLLARIAPGSRGAVRARAVIAAASPLAERAPESVVRWIALSRGMPTPVLQKPVDTARGRVYTDMAWQFQIAGRRMWLHVEFDGTGKYLADPRGRTTAQVLIDERKRESAIRDEGDVVVRVYWDEIQMENWVFTKITQGIAREVVERYRRVPALYRPSTR